MEQSEILFAARPAEDWVECFPQGNGKIGIMDNGSPYMTKIWLNDDTLWSGFGKDKNRDAGRSVLDRIRAQVNANEFAEAEKSIKEELLSDWTESYLPLGFLTIDRELGNDSVKHYKRILDLKSGIQDITFMCDGKRYRRTEFVSYPDKTAVISITASRKDDCTLSADSELSSMLTVKDDAIILDGIAPTHVAPLGHDDEEPIYYDPDIKGMSFAGYFRILTDGETVAENRCLKIIGYKRLDIVYTSMTSFDNGGDLIAKCAQITQRAAERGIPVLTDSHTRDFGNLYGRTSLELRGSKGSTILTTEELLRKYQYDETNTAAIVNLFNFGRYLMISASRQGTAPMNLQGIWNKELRPPWSSNYTLNINTQMNYWGAEILNLSELHSPLLDFISRIAENGRETARRTYGMNGFVCHHNSDIWAHTSPVGRLAETNPCRYALFIGTGGWLAFHLWEHYLFTEDIRFLHDNAYPIMRSSAEFYLDYLTRDDQSGDLIPSPSASPENAFRYRGVVCSVNKASTIDVSVIKRLFASLIEAAHILDDAEDSLIARVRVAFQQLPPYRTDRKGAMREWYDEYAETEKRHRHLSHLYALYPSGEISPEGTPELAEACLRSLKRRGGDGTGWSIAWKVNLYARLKMGDEALALLKKQLRPVSAKGKTYHGGSYISLFCAHPPFQIDGNFGAAAGIAEMLLQSHRNYIELLPALPLKWQSGSVKGLRARGNYTVNFKWKKGEVSEFEIKSDTARTVNVKINDTYDVYPTDTVIRPNKDR